MAIALGSVNTTGDTSGSYTSIAVSGANTIGYIFAIGDTSDNLTGITWGGSAMTKVASGRPGTDRYIGLWYIINPSSSSTITLTGGTYKEAYEFYYTGAKQSAQPDSYTDNSSSLNAALTLTTTVVATGCWTVMISKDDGTGNVNYTTNVGVVRIGPNGGGLCMSDSNGTVGTGNQATTHTLNSGTPNHYGVVVSIAPSGSAFIPKVMFI